MISIDGIRNLSAPNIIRDMIEDRIPAIAAKCFLLFNHCSTKTEIKSAVSAKSIPAVLKVISDPITAPISEPVIQ
jgi:hypothetical protein